MAKPIQHDTASSVSTAAWEVGKWSIVGVVTAGLLTAGALVGAVGLIGGAAAAGAMLTGGLAVLTAAVAVAGGLIFGAEGALLGGLLGLAKGGSRVARENAAYRDQIEHRSLNHQHKQAQKLNDAAIAGMQQGYQAGFQEGAQHVVNQIQQMQMTALEQQMAAQKGAGAHASKVSKCDSKVEALNKSREAAAAAGNQLGV